MEKLFQILKEEKQYSGDYNSFKSVFGSDPEAQSMLHESLKSQDLVSRDFESWQKKYFSGDQVFDVDAVASTEKKNDSPSQGLPGSPVSGGQQKTVSQPTVESGVLGGQQVPAAKPGTPPVSGGVAKPTFGDDLIKSISEKPTEELVWNYIGNISPGLLPKAPTQADVTLGVSEALTESNRFKEKAGRELLIDLDRVRNSAMSPEAKMLRSKELIAAKVQQMVAAKPELAGDITAPIAIREDLVKSEKLAREANPAAFSEIMDDRMNTAALKSDIVEGWNPADPIGSYKNKMISTAIQIGMDKNDPRYKEAFMINNLSRVKSNPNSSPELIKKYENEIKVFRDARIAESMAKIREEETAIAEMEASGGFDQAELNEAKARLRAVKNDIDGYLNPDKAAVSAYAATDSKSAPGETPMEQMKNHLARLVHERNELRGSISGPEQVVGVFADSERGKRLDEVEAQIKVLTPVVLLNEAPEFTGTEEQGFGGAYARSFMQGLFPKGWVQRPVSQQEQAQSVLQSFTQAGVDIANYDPAKLDALNERSKGYGIGDMRYIGETLGGTSAFMIQAIPGGAAVKPLQIGKIISGSKYFGRAANVIAEAVESGLAYEASGRIVPKADENLNFAAGALGGAGKAMFELMPFLNKEGQSAVKKFILGRAGGAAGETIEETGNTIGEVWEKHGMDNFVKGMGEQFQSVDDVVKFIVTTAVMGAALGTGTDVGRELVNESQQRFEGASPEQQAVAQGMIDELKSDAVNIQKEGAKVLTEQATAQGIEQPIEAAQAFEVGKGGEFVETEEQSIRFKNKAEMDEFLADKAAFPEAYSNSKNEAKKFRFRQEMGLVGKPEPINTLRGLGEPGSMEAPADVVAGTPLEPTAQVPVAPEAAVVKPELSVPEGISRLDPNVSIFDEITEEQINEAVKPVVVQGQEATVAPESKAATAPESKAKAYDFDNTLYDPKTGQLTPLGEEVKARIAAGEEITIVTARNGKQTAAITKALGISKDKIQATGDEAKKGEVLDRLGIAREDYYDADQAKMEAIQGRVPAAPEATMEPTAPVAQTPVAPEVNPVVESATPAQKPAVEPTTETQGKTQPQTQAAPTAPVSTGEVTFNVKSKFDDAVDTFTGNILSESRDSFGNKKFTIEAEVDGKLEKFTVAEKDIVSRKEAAAEPQVEPTQDAVPEGKPESKTKKAAKKVKDKFNDMASSGASFDQKEEARKLKEFLDALVELGIAVMEDGATAAADWISKMKAETPVGVHQYIDQRGFDAVKRRVESKASAASTQQGKPKQPSQRKVDAEKLSIGIFNRVVRNIAKRLGISENKYRERLSVINAANSVSQVAGAIIGRDLDNSPFTDYSGNEPVEVLFQSEEQTQTVLRHVPSLDAKRDNILITALSNSNLFNKFIGGAKKDVNAAKRSELNAKQKELGELFKNKQGGTDKAQQLKSEVERIKKELAAEESVETLTREQAVKMLEDELAGIAYNARNTDDFYIKDFSDDYIDRQIDYNEEQGNQQMADQWKHLKENKSARKNEVEAQRNQQKSALLQGLNYLIGNSTYPVEFQFLMANAALNYNINNEGYISKRNENTVGLHNELSSAVLPAVLEEMRDGNTDNPVAIYNKHAFKEFMSPAKTKEVASKYVVEKRPGGVWVKFPQNATQDVVADMQALAKQTHRHKPNGSWCTGGAFSTAEMHNKGGDFYMFIDNNGEVQLAMRYSGLNLGESRGIGSGQSITPDMLNEVEYFYDKYPNASGFRDTLSFNKLYNKYRNGKKLEKNDVKELIRVHNIGDGSYGYNTKIEDLKGILRGSADVIAEVYGLTEDEIFIEGSYGDIGKNTVLYIGTFKPYGRENAPNLREITGSAFFEAWKGSAPKLTSIGGHAYFEDWTGSAPELATIGKDAVFRYWKGSAPKLTSIGGNAEFREWDGTADNLTTIGGNADLYRWGGDLPKLTTIGGGANFVIWEGSAPKLTSIGGDANFYEWYQDATSLTSIGGTANFGAWTGSAPELATIGKDAVFHDWKGSAPKLTSIGGNTVFRDWTGSAPKLKFIGGRVNGLMQNDPRMPSLENNTLFQDERGAIVKQGDKSTIILGKLADPTTRLHEIAHEYERVLTDAEKDAVLEWTGHKKWTTDTSEAFAKGFERYLYEGKAPSKAVENVFKAFADFLSTLIKDFDSYFKGTKELNPKMRAIYDGMVASGLADTQPVAASTTGKSQQGKQAAAEPEVEEEGEVEVKEKKERGASVSAREKGGIDIGDALSETAQFYTPRGMKDVEGYAREYIKKHGTEGVIEYMNSSGANFDTAVVAGKELLKHYHAQAKNATSQQEKAAALRSAANVAEALLELGTRLGQGVNAYKGWGDGMMLFGPEFMRQFAARKVNSVKKKVLERTEAVDSAAFEAIKDGAANAAKSASNSSKVATAIDSAIEEAKPETILGLTREQIKKRQADALTKAKDALKFKGNLYSGGDPRMILDAIAAIAEYGVYLAAEGVVSFKAWSSRIKAVMPNATDDMIEKAWEADYNGMTPEKVAARKSAASRLESIVGDKKEKASDPMKKVADIVRTKVNGRVKPVPKTPAESLAEAVMNAEKYADAWNEARASVANTIMAGAGTDAEKQSKISALNAALDEAIGKPFSDSVVKKAIRDEMKLRGQTIKDMIADYDLAKMTSSEIAEKIASDTGLEQPQAERIAKAVKDEFSAMVKKAKRDELTRKLGKNGKVYFDFIDKHGDDLTAQQWNDYLKEKYEMPELTEETLLELDRIASEAAELPEGSHAQAKKGVEAMNVLSKIDGIDKAGFFWDLYYAKILSGPKTHVRNIFGNIYNGLSEVMISGIEQGIRQKSVMPIVNSVTGFFNGLASLGASMSADIMASGMATKGGKFEDPGTLESIVSGDNAIKFLGKPGEKITKALSYAKYVGRALAAEDAFFYQGFRGMRMKELIREAVLNDAKAVGRNMSAKEVWSLVNDKMYGTKEEQAAAEKAVEVESQKYGYTNREKAIRYFEIMEQRLPSNIRKDADEYGSFGTYNYDPKGFLGAISNSISAFKKSKKGGNLMSLIIPFTRVPANVLNQQLSYSPWAFMRLASKAKSADFELITTEQRNREMIKGVLGTVLWSSAIGFLVAEYLLNDEGDDDDKDRKYKFILHGQGPSKYEDKQLLMQTGWMPYSAEIMVNGKTTFVPFDNTAFALPMVTAATLKDMFKYRDFSKKEIGDIAFAVVANSMSSIADRSFLSGLGDFFDIMAGDQTAGNKLENLLVRTTTPIPNLIPQVVSWFDPVQYKAETLAGQYLKDIPVVRDMVGVKPMLDVFGRPVTDPRKSTASVIFSNKKPDPVVEFMVENGISIAKPGKSTKINGELVTDDQLYEIVEKAGPLIYKDILAKKDIINKLPDKEAKQKYVNDKIRDIHLAKVKQQIATGGK